MLPPHTGLKPQPPLNPPHGMLPTFVQRHGLSHVQPQYVGSLQMVIVVWNVHC
jgi:hypothetical protein